METESAAKFSPNHSIKGFCPTHNLHCVGFCVTKGCQNRLICLRCSITHERGHNIFSFEEFHSNPNLIFSATPELMQKDLQSLMREKMTNDEISKATENRIDSIFDDFLVNIEELVNNIRTSIKALFADMIKERKRILDYCNSIWSPDRLLELFEKDDLQEFSRIVHENLLIKIDESLNDSLNQYAKMKQKITKFCEGTSLNPIMEYITRNVITPLPSRQLDYSTARGRTFTQHKNFAFTGNLRTISIPECFKENNETILSTSEIKRPFRIELGVKVTKRKGMQIGLINRMVERSDQFPSGAKTLKFFEKKQQTYLEIPTGTRIWETKEINLTYRLTFDVDQQGVTKIYLDDDPIAVMILPNDFSTFLYVNRTENDIAAEISIIELSLIHI
eukprot:TRINITY_DN8544_c0_g1_i3.p1 TRINITY_DN8544_c0_g1~~TRINITY_DN8544_c0_g1_i3.p1  ORF type:complete len:391 (-),score=52.81 TRINITY_DN8544_c0_g1_i3:62-1234(-)